MSIKPRTNKKQRGKKLMVAMGDTVKLTKGRIGLIRYIGKTQFGLGEWVGIELYNELIRTRHNGAVLGKRYFRCPPHRGVFIRRSLIKENIAVLDIQPSINKLRAKEKKIKKQRNKLRAKDREAKKIKNEEKREAKRLKIQAKYAQSTKPKAIEAKIESVTSKKKMKRLQARSQTPTATSRSRRARTKSPNRSKVPHSVNTASFQISKPRKQRARTPTDPTNRKKKKRAKTPTSGKKKAQAKNTKKKKEKIRTSSAAKYESESENDEEEEEAFPDIPNIMSVAEPMVARQVKVKHKSDDKKIKKSYSTDLTQRFKSMEKANAKRTASKKHVRVRTKPHAMQKSKTLPQKPEIEDEDEDDDDDESPSVSKDSVDIPIFQQDSLLSRSSTQPQIMRIVDEDKIQSENVNKGKKKISIEDADGVIDSDDSSLNDDEEEADEDDRELQKELEEDFEENFEKFHDVLDEYTHTIEDIETGRKILANRVVADTRRRISLDQQNDDGQRAGGRQRANGLAKFRQRSPRKIINNFQRKKQPKVMLSLPRKRSRQFDAARSRRGSSFVDKYNLNDTLFFDGDEENEEVYNEDTDIEEKEEQSKEDEKQSTPKDIKTNVFDVKDTILQKGGDATPTIVEEDDDADDDDDDDEEPEVENDPLLGTIEDIIDETQSEYEEEEFKIFDLEHETAKVKKMKFYVELNEFIEWETCQNGNGIKISKVNTNEYGKALFIETGVERGWIIAHINGDDITEKTKEDIASEIEKCNVENGYDVTFTRGKDEEDDKTDSDTNKKVEENTDKKEENVDGKHGGGDSKDIDEEINEINNLKPSVYMKKKKQSE